MIKRQSFLVVLLALSGVAANSVAQPSLQAGLWEHSFEMTSESGRLEAAMAQVKQMLDAMPPEQRQMLERQMANSGMSLNLDNYTARVCITEAQAARNEFPEPSENCTQSFSEQSAGVFELEFRCDGNPPVSAVGEMRLISDKEYRGTVTTETSIEGQSERMTISQNGVWLSADCE